MVTQIDFKTFGYKKNAEIVGMVFIVHILEINYLTNIIVSVSAVLVQIGKKFLPMTIICSKKMLPIIENPQKQTP